jgi:hypothetical protein
MVSAGAVENTNVDDNTNRGPARDANGRFGPGNPGRPHGARNRMPKRLAFALLIRYADDKAEMLETLRADRFLRFKRRLGRLLPSWPGSEKMTPVDAAAAVRDALGHRPRVARRSTVARWFEDYGE